MEDKKQVLSHGKTPGENEQRIARSISCSPDHPMTRSPDDPVCSPDPPIARSPDREICSPDRPITPSLDRDICSPAHPIARSPDAPICLPNSSHCRECLAALAHRLAQPMTALRGGMELGLMGKRSVADYRALLEQSIQLADSMAQLIVSMRDLGESGAPGGPSQSILLEATATEVLAELEGL